MKHIFKTIAIIGVLFMVSSCKESTYTKIDGDVVFVGMKGGSKNLVIHSDANHFKTLYTPSWAEVSYKDSIMTVNMGVNDTKRMRKGFIIVGNGDQKQSVQVVQATRASYFLVNDDKMVINKEGGPNELSVYTDGYEVTAEVPDNVKVDYQYGKLLFSNEGNDGGTRKTKIKLVCEGLEKEMILVEEGDICGTCNGRGTVVCPICGGSGMTYCPMMTCVTCNGRGRVTCPDCGGKKKQ